MEDAEAREVVSRDDREFSELLHLAQGWPAVIGLVRLSSQLAVSPESLPDQLYEYFGQELYDELPERDRLPLAELSFAPEFDNQFAELLLGPHAAQAIAAGLNAGVLAQPRRDAFEIHPLFSKLLQDRAFPSRLARQQAATRAGHVLVKTDRWDDAFAVARDLALPAVLLAAVEEALEKLVDLGRIATVNRWLEAAAAVHCESPVLDLAEAEVAFRTGDYNKAEALARQAAQHPDLGSQLVSRAYARAGHGALLANREHESIDHFRKARETATKARDVREALFGLYSALSELEEPEATHVLDNLDHLDLETPDDQLRNLGIKLTEAVRAGKVNEAIDTVDDQIHLLERATDPLNATSFLHAFTSALTMRGYYQRSLDVAERLYLIAEEQRLDFVRPFALIDRAVARLGMRDFARAKRDIASAAREVPRDGDVHIEGNLAAIQCRLLIALGRPAEAAAATEIVFSRGTPTKPLLAEMLVYRALALACASHHSSALAMLNEAESVSATSLEVRVLGPAIRAIGDRHPAANDPFTAQAWSSADCTGNINSLVYAYRGYPDLLPRLAEVANGDRLGEILIAANDIQLAQRCGLKIRASTPRLVPLTPRETEVMNMIAAGLSNREVANTLFVSEATVKVHVRHAYEKLGVRRRPEAITKWLTLR
jgi:DNA-binding CsgD family transcriptional regulator